MKIITNNQLRELICGLDLTEKEKKEFDYLDEDELNSESFFRYQGNVYHLGDFIRIRDYKTFENSDFKNWDGYSAGTYFSGILVKLVDDEVIVGRYYS